jgi:hypothetical protein
LQHSNQQLYFPDDNTFNTWMHPGDRGIVCRQQWTTKICRLLPCAQPVRYVKTAELKCDCNFGLGMVTIVRSSNEIAACITNVMIETTDLLLWTNQTKKIKGLPSTRIRWAFWFVRDHYHTADIAEITV